MNQTKCPPNDALAKYAVGNLATDEMSALDTHVDSCTRCQKTLDQLSGDQLREGSDSLVAQLHQVPLPSPYANEPQLQRALKEACQQASVTDTSVSGNADTSSRPPFDPYHAWLSIPPTEQPPNLYRLLGLDLFEKKDDVIDSAADRQMAHVRTFQGGKHRDHSQKLLNEISNARITLLDKKKRDAYDVQLRERLDEQKQPGELPAWPKGKQPKTVADFEKCLVAAGLFSKAEIREYKEGLPAKDQPKTIKDFAMGLARANRLTRYQALVAFEGLQHPLVYGPYVVLEEIGAGGMGKVFKARHRHMDRLVALKVLAAGALSSSKALERFHQEVKAAAQLSHPNIVAAYDAGEQDGTHYFVMEFVDGRDLSDVVKDRGALPVTQAVGYVLQAARGLEYAHSQGIIHRDIKPANLIVAQASSLRNEKQDARHHESSVKILDMGLARMDSLGDSNEEARQLTESGQLMGTVDYMSPEQAEDTRSADRRADIYSLGCTLYRLLTGKSPYAGKTAMQVLLAHREAPIPSLCEACPEVPESLDNTFQKMLAKNRDERQESMSDVITELETALQFCETPAANANPVTIAPKAHAISASRDAGLTEFFDNIGDDAPRAVESPKVSRKTSKSTMSPTWILGGVIVGGLAFLILLGAVVIKLTTPMGEIEVVLDEGVADSIELVVTEGGKQVDLISKIDGWKVSVSDGEYKLDIKGGNDRFEVQDKKVSIYKGNVATVRVTLKPVHNGKGIEVNPSSKSVDLLAMIDPIKHTVVGEWSWQDNVLLSKGAKAARIQVPYTPPESYVLRAKVRRVSGSEGVNLGIIVDDCLVCMGLDAYSSTTSGISSVDDMYFDTAKNPTQRRLRVFENGQIAEIVCRVGPGEVCTEVNGREILHWKEDSRRFTKPDWFTFPNERQLALGTEVDPYEFHSLTLRPIHPDDVAPRSGLTAEYFADGEFSKPVISRRDQVVDFQWREGSPHPEVPNDMFSARWQGWIKAPQPGKYRFQLYVDDDASLYLDDKLVVKSAELRIAPYDVEVQLTDRPHRIRIDYVETKDTGRISLRWVRPGNAAEEVVPSECLFTTLAAAEKAKVVLRPLLGSRQPVQPFVLPVEGIPGITELQPEESPPEAWRVPGVFARITGQGKLRFPPIPSRHYVIEWTMRVDAAGGDFDFKSRTHPNHAEAQFHWDPEAGPRGANVCLLQDHPGTGGTFWNGGRHVGIGDTHKLKMIVFDGKVQLVFDDAYALGCHNVSGDGAFEMEAEWIESLVTVFDAKIRQIRADDARWIGPKVPSPFLRPRATLPVVEAEVAAGETVDLTDRIISQMHDSVVSGDWSVLASKIINVGSSAHATLRMPVDLSEAAEYKLSFSFTMRDGKEAIQTILPANNQFFLALVNDSHDLSRLIFDNQSFADNATTKPAIKLELKKTYDYEARVQVREGKLAAQVHVRPEGEPLGEPYLVIIDQPTKDFQLPDWLRHISPVIEGQGTPAFQGHFSSGSISDVQLKVFKGRAKILAWKLSAND